MVFTPPRFGGSRFSSRPQGFGQDVTAVKRTTFFNIDSINAYCGERNLLAYSISKAGLMALTRNLADAVYFLSDEAPLINGAILDLEQYPLVGRNPARQF